MTHYKDWKKRASELFLICNTTYKDILYTTLLTLLALLTTQYYDITFSFPFTHTEREKNEKEKNEKEEKETTYYICTLGTPRYHI